MQLSNLLDLAVANSGVKSFSKLAFTLEISPSAIRTWRNGWNVPTDKHLITLAKMARVQPEIILLWAAAWRSEGEAVARWERMAQEAETRFGFTSAEEKAA